MQIGTAAVHKKLLQHSITEWRMCVRIMLVCVCVFASVRMSAYMRHNYCVYVTIYLHRDIYVYI